MVEIRMLPEGRFEVHADGRHCEAFEGCLGAIAVAHALAAELAAEARGPIVIHTPWGEKTVSEPTPTRVLD